MTEEKSKLLTKNIKDKVETIVEMEIGKKHSDADYQLLIDKLT